MYTGEARFTADLVRLALGIFRALPTPDLVASSVAIALSGVLWSNAQAAAVVGARATGGGVDGRPEGVDKEVSDKRDAAVASGETETQRKGLVGTNLPDLWNEAIGHPRFFCRDLFGPAADTLPRTYNLSTVLRPGPRPPDSKLVRRRLLRSKTWAGHFFTPLTPKS